MDEMPIVCAPKKLSGIRGHRSGDVSKLYIFSSSCSTNFLAFFLCCLRQYSCINRLTGLILMVNKVKQILKT